MAEDMWKTVFFGKSPNIKGSTLITGLPGIGNVGKIVADFLIDELNAKKICEFASYYMPHSVFVNEKNLIEMPKIELYFYNKAKLLILAGDTQPIDEISCYSFCDHVLDYFEKNKCKEIITLGGIGLASLPKTPKVYCTGNDKSIIMKYKKGTKVITKIYGIVGPIVGVSGLMLGLASRRNIKAASLLAETLGHPMYIGLKGSREILKVLNKKLLLNIDLKKLEKEIKDFESKIKLTEELLKTTKQAKDINYIG